MASSVQVEGEAQERGSRAPAVAKAFYLRVLLTKYPNMGARNQAGLQLLATVLDHLALGRHKEAMDTVAQEMKAVERAIQDENWRDAGSLRLLDDKYSTLLEEEDHALVASVSRDRFRHLGGKGGWTGGKTKGESWWSKDQSKGEWPKSEGKASEKKGEKKPV